MSDDDNYETPQWRNQLYNPNGLYNGWYTSKQLPLHCKSRGGPSRPQVLERQAPYRMSYRPRNKSIPHT
jgi:hypothetical protein